MPTTADYLNNLITQRDNLADNLVTKGVTASKTELLDTLVPKVLQIEGGGGGTIKYTIFNSLGSTSKQDTLDEYGSLVYISQDATNTNFNSLDVTISEQTGGLNGDGFIGPAERKYGLCMSNWLGPSSNVSTSCFFIEPVTVAHDVIFVKINAYISSWMTVPAKVHLLTANGDTPEELLTNIKTKVVNRDFVLTIDTKYNGNASLTDCFWEVTLPHGEYYVFFDGTVFADNSSFTITDFQIYGC